MTATAVPVTPADRLGFTLFLALALHATLILGLGFADEKPGASPRTIEVTIAHRLSDREPEEADFLAQASQLGSGDEAETREVTTTETAPFDQMDAPHVQLRAPGTLAPSPVVTQRLTLTTQGLSSRRIRAPRQADRQPPKPLPRADVESEEVLSQEVASLQARLDRQKQAYARRPRIQRLTSVSARAHYEALYVDAFRREVEDVGTRNFPGRALREGKFGNVRLMVALLPDGRVREIQVLQSSGHAFLDEAAVKSVRLAAPFSPFTPEMKRNFDVLEIIRTWKFDPDQLVTSH